MSGAQTFELSPGRVFVSGLFWQPISGFTPAARQMEIEKIAAEQSLDLFVIRTASIHQVGFGSVADGLRAGFLSVAAAIAKTIEIDGGVRNFLCAVEEPGGRWVYVAQREGVILHDGDLLGTEDEIRSRMLADISLSEWGAIFAPGHWGIGEAVEKKLLDFFPTKAPSKVAYKRWWALKHVKTTWRDVLRDYWRVGALCLLVVAVSVGYTQWQKYQLEQEAIRIAAEEAARAEAERRMVKQKEHPWKKIARARRFLEACDAAQAGIGTLWPGNWTFQNTTCADGALTVTWVRQEHGWVEHLQAILPKAVFSPDGASATLTVPVELPAGDDEMLPMTTPRKLKMYGVAQQYGLQIQFKAEPAARLRLPGDPAPSEQPGSEWKELPWSISTQGISPSAILPALDSNGFRVQQIRTIIVNGVMNWEMEGIQYVRP